MAAVDSFQKRRRARVDWPVRKFRLGEEPDDGLADTTVEERVGMVWQLTLDAWACAGRRIPDYPRSEMPVRVLRNGAPTAAK